MPRLLTFKCLMWNPFRTAKLFFCLSFSSAILFNNPYSIRYLRYPSGFLVFSSFQNMKFICLCATLLFFLNKTNVFASFGRGGGFFMSAPFLVTYSQKIINCWSTIWFKIFDAFFSFWQCKHIFSAWKTWIKMSSVDLLVYYIRYIKHGQLILAILQFISICFCYNAGW